MGDTIVSLDGGTVAGNPDVFPQGAWPSAKGKSVAILLLFRNTDTFPVDLDADGKAV